MIPPGSVEMGPASPRGPVFVRPRVDVADEEPPPNAAPTPEEPAAAPDDAEPATPPPLSPLPPDDDAVPPRHKPLQQRVSPRSVLLVPDEQDRTVDIDVYVEDEEDEEHLDRLTTLRKRGYLAFYDRPPLMTVALVLSWIFVQRRRGFPPYDEDAYCLGPDTPFKTVFAHAYAHSSREHLYSNCLLYTSPSPRD